MDNLSPAERSACMSRIRGKNTKPELLVRSVLHRAGYRFRLHRRDLPGAPDIVFPSRRKVIFVHGCFWHGHSCGKGALPTSRADFWRNKIEATKKRDRSSAAKLRVAGWQSFVLWECELRDREGWEARLTKFLNTRRNNEHQRAAA
jgi:DNA mismatch endonuclease, patch repair protein